MLREAWEVEPQKPKTVKAITPSLSIEIVETKTEFSKPTDSEKKIIETEAPVTVREDKMAVRELQPPRDLGKGGPEHRAIQKQIKEVAVEFGFRSVIEKQCLPTQESIDLSLERGDQKIACEISISTPIDHEVDNVAKCLTDGYSTIAIICMREERLRQISMAVLKRLGSEAAEKVKYYFPDTFISHLKNLPQPAENLPETVKNRRGYKVKRSLPSLTPEAQKQKEEAAIRSIAEAMRRKKP
jgi:hypothetical protein